MNPAEQAAEAHRRAFATLTDALGNPDADPRKLLDSLTGDRDDVLDTAACLVWHAAGALVTFTGDRDAALHLVQVAAITQEGATYE